jgi:hypothetical protein
MNVGEDCASGMSCEKLYHLTSEGWVEFCSESLRLETWRVTSEAIGCARLTLWACIWHSGTLRFEERHPYTSDLVCHQSWKLLVAKLSAAPMLVANCNRPCLGNDRTDRLNVISTIGHRIVDVIPENLIATGRFCFSGGIPPLGTLSPSITI